MFGQLVGQRVVIVGRYVWNGLLKSVDGTFFVLDDCEQATWADAEQKREVIAQRVNGLCINASWIEAIYPESQAKWGQKS